MNRTASGKRARNLIEERVFDVLAELIDSGYDGDREKCCNHCIFDGGGAAGVGEKLQSRSRNMGTSGRSAAGIA